MRPETGRARVFGELCANRCKGASQVRHVFRFGTSFLRRRRPSPARCARTLSRWERDVGKLCENRIENAFQVRHHVVVPESDNTAAALREPRGASGIVLDHVSMLTTVDVDNETGLFAEEIEHVRK